MKIDYKTNTIGYLDITFGPKWDYIPLTKNYIENFLMINLVNKKHISRIAMSASEFLENAVKFSNKDGIRVIIDKLGEKNQIQLQVFNFLKKDEADRLFAMIDKMNSEDPLKYYIKKMKETVARHDDKAELGLARINYEGGAKISANYLEDDNIVELRAIFNLK